MLKSEIVDISKKKVKHSMNFFAHLVIDALFSAELLKRPKAPIGFGLEGPKRYHDFEQCSDDLLVGSIFGTHLMGSLQSDRCWVLIHKKLDELLVEI